MLSLAEGVILREVYSKHPSLIQLLLLFAIASKASCGSTWCTELMAQLGLSEIHVEGSIDIPQYALETLTPMPTGKLFYLDTGSEGHVFRRITPDGKVRILKQYYREPQIGRDRIFFSIASSFKQGGNRFKFPKNIEFNPELKRIEYDDVRGIMPSRITTRAFAKHGSMKPAIKVIELYNERLKMLRDDFLAAGWLVRFSPAVPGRQEWAAMSVGRTEQELDAGQSGFHISAGNVILDPETLEMTLIDPS